MRSKATEIGGINTFFDVYWTASLSGFNKYITVQRRCCYGKVVLKARSINVMGGLFFLDNNSCLVSRWKRSALARTIRNDAEIAAPSRAKDELPYSVVWNGPILVDRIRLYTVYSSRSRKRTTDDEKNL